MCRVVGRFACLGRAHFGRMGSVTCNRERGNKKEQCTVNGGESSPSKKKRNETKTKKQTATSSYHVRRRYSCCRCRYSNETAARRCELTPAPSACHAIASLRIASRRITMFASAPCSRTSAPPPPAVFAYITALLLRFRTARLLTLLA